MSRKSRRKKYIYKPNPKKEAEAKKRAKKLLIIFAAVFAAILAVIIISFLRSENRKNDYKDTVLQKIELLREKSEEADPQAPVALGGSANTVFISVSDGATRAHVLRGSGITLADAWDDAAEKTGEYVYDNKIDVKWLKSDVVTDSKNMSYMQFRAAHADPQEQYYRFGVVFNNDVSTALLEEQLNGYLAFDYESGDIDFENLNQCYTDNGTETLKGLPSECTVFSCRGLFCDENNEVYELGASGISKGRRIVENIDSAYADGLIDLSSQFLLDSLNDDGSFVYGYHPCFGKTLTSYNILRHSGSIWTLALRYLQTGDESLKEQIEKAIDYVIDTAVIYSDDDTAYLLETKDDEIKLGGSGIFVVALTEYMDAFGNDDYADIAAKLGNGILAMMDSETGEYIHVLNSDFSIKEKFRTVYYDGEATFALSRLYSLTKDQKWLDAAEAAVRHFIAADYTQYKDHWISYAVNELTKYVDNVDYYTFGLQNVQNNLKRIAEKERTNPVNLELLMAAFEMYDRIMTKGIDVPYLSQFDVPEFLRTIYARVDNQLNGFGYPELAMYMEEPAKMLNAFMVREDQFRVRIDDIQHNCGGLYLYSTYYDKLLDYGMMEYVANE